MFQGTIDHEAATPGDQDAAAQAAISSIEGIPDASPAQRRPVIGKPLKLIVGCAQWRIRDETGLSVRSGALKAGFHAVPDG